MPTGRCSLCGVQVALDVAGPFAGAEVVGAFCPACAEQHFIETGGCVLTLRQEIEGARFPLRKITITAGTATALGESAEHAITFLARHVHGDWGQFGDCDQIVLTDDERQQGWEATEEDAKINKSNLLNGRDRIMSEYLTHHGQRLWVITALARGNETTVLLPEEY